MGFVTEEFIKSCKDAIVKRCVIEEPVKYKDKEVGQAKMYVEEGKLKTEIIIFDFEIVADMKAGTKRLISDETGHRVYDIDK